MDKQTITETSIGLETTYFDLNPEQCIDGWNKIKELYWSETDPSTNASV